MGRITSGVGLVSGINSRDIIDQLIAVEGRPRRLLEARIEQANTRKTALNDIQAKLTTLRVRGATLKRPSSFRDAAATSSDDKIVTATASAGAASGSYDIRVARLVTSQQSVSRGFADASTTRVGAGQLTLEIGGGDLSQTNLLDELNGGRGVQRGSFRITDRAGKSSVVNIADAVSLDDVVKKINNSLDVNVRATIDGDKLKITDKTGLSVGALKIENVGTDTVAGDLGITGAAVGDTITGTTIRTIGNSTSLSTLNDGLGVSRSKIAPDIRIVARDGSSTDVELGTGGSLGDIVKAINTAGTNKFSASVDPSGKGLLITDLTGGGGALSVSSINDSKSAEDLGLTGLSAGNTLTGNALVADLGTTLLRTLNGGRGITLGTISIANRNGVSTTYDFSGATDVQDILDTVNAANSGVTARLKSGGGNGIELIDTTGGAGNLVVSDLSGTIANDLGIAGSFGTQLSGVRGANLQRKWIGENTALKDLNGGKGIPAGSIKLTNSAGEVATFNLGATTITSVGDVLRTINGRTSFGVTARINDNGDGIELVDTKAGAGKLRVDESGSSTARGLNLLGTAATTTINGSFEKTVAIDATDTLTDVQTKINDASWGLSASIINDGTSANSFRLNLTTLSSGRAGRVVFDDGAIDLGTRTLVESQDAVVLIGDTNSAGGKPLVVTASSNSINGAIRGVNIQLNGVSNSSTRLNIAQDVSSVAETIKGYVTTFNELNVSIKDYTKFDTTTNERGVLLGDSAVAGVQTQIFGTFTSILSQSGRYRTAFDVGIRVGANSQLEFDEDKFRAAFAADPAAVTQLFTASDNAIDTETSLSQLNSGRGVRSNSVGTPDMRFRLRDGTSFEYDFDDVRTVADLQRTISTASAGKVSIAISSTTGSLRVVDSTTGIAAFVISGLNGSVAGDDLGITGTGTNGAIDGRRIASQSAGATRGGIGTQIESRINKLIDPVNGTITKSTLTIDQRNEDSRRRVEGMNRVLESKRTRLERQFTAMEETLSRLQNQQSSLLSLNTNNFQR